MISLSYRKAFGSRIRSLREQRGWPQAKAALRIPLSQKHLSRIELGDVSVMDRHLLIRLGEIFESPIASGEVNQWLHAFGYRPHMVPLLPLPDNIDELLAYYSPLPATIIDLGRYIRYMNSCMATLYRLDFQHLPSPQQNWLWHYFHPNGMLSNVYPKDSAIRILNRLFWDWEPYYFEPWNVTLRAQLESALGISWKQVQETYHIPTNPLCAPMSEFVAVSPITGHRLEFKIDTEDIPFRPDLFVIVYHPTNLEANKWCTLYG